MIDFDESKAAFERALRPSIDAAYEHLGKISDATTRGDMARGDIMSVFERVGALIAIAEKMASALYETDEEFKSGFDAATRALRSRDDDGE